jgi:tetratricopeptide (TPR) repeat protein
MAALPILNRLGSLFQRKHASPAAPSTPAAETAATTAAGTAASATSSISTASDAVAAGAGALSDPIVSQTNQELAAQQAEPVPTEEDQLVAAQHPAWAAYDFERCIVIFSRLLQIHPDDEGYKEKLVASYYNRGKQYEAQGDERRATQLYYSALSVDPNFTPAQEAAEAFLNNVEGEGGQSGGA